MSRSTTIWRTAGLLAAAGLALAACGTTGGGEGGTDDGGGGEGGEDCSGVLAYVGPLTGPAANLGVNIVNGSQLALEQFQEANPDCEVSIERADTQGDPAQATNLVSEIVSNNDIVGVIGPTFSGETAATGEVFAQAGLVTVSPSATNPDLALNEWDTFHRIIGNDDTQAPAVATYLEGVGAEGVFVIDDASEYGAGLGAGVEEGLGDLVVGTETIQVGDTDFGPAVTAVNASGADAVYFAGYYAEAAALVGQLRSGGYDGLFMSGDGTLDPGFVEGAGAAADGAVLTCPCAPADDEFAAAYEASAGQAPGTYSTEGYDAANILLQGILAGNTDRESLLEWVNNYDAEGVTKHIKFDETGEVAEVVVYAYPVEGGEIQLGEPIE